MAEFSGIPPLGLNSIVRPAPAAPPPAVPGVEAGLKGGGLSGQMSSDARQSVPTRARAPEQAKAETGSGRPDPQQLAGPSPSFQASVLELELDLQNTIARVEAKRGRRESDIAGVTVGATRDIGKDASEPSPDMGRDAETLREADGARHVSDAARTGDTAPVRPENPPTGEQPEPTARPADTD